MKPFLRWAGSKRKLISQLTPYWQGNFKRYVEPFMGSAVLYFSINPNRALLSDINGELVDTFNAVKKHPRAIHNRLISMPREKNFYYDLRAKDPTKLSLVDRATRFIYLNRYCFNGLYRTNNSGHFNVPYGSGKTGELPDFSSLKEISKRLQQTNIFKSDYEDILKKHVKKGDFVYLDPPYAVENKRVFKQYGPHVFGTDDLNKLIAQLPNLHKKGAGFLVSYVSNDYTHEAFKDWPTQQIVTQRNIAGFSKHRRQEKELLVSNIPLLN